MGRLTLNDQGYGFWLQVRWWFARLRWAMFAPSDRDWMCHEWWEERA